MMLTVQQEGIWQNVLSQLSYCTSRKKGRC